jgi:hypothetical protein
MVSTSGLVGIHSGKKDESSEFQRRYGIEMGTVHTIIKKILHEIKKIPSIIMGITHGVISFECASGNFIDIPSVACREPRRNLSARQAFLYPVTEDHERKIDACESPQ